MPGRPYILTETTWKAVRGASFEVAVLPWGATEAHNLHLPYGTDVMECDAVAAAAAALAWDAGARVIVLPTVPFGVNTGQLDIFGCLNMNPSTQAAVLRDIVRSLEPHGVRKLVILNGHGGNDFKPLIRELQAETAMFVCALEWYRSLDADRYFDEPGDHAGELETSVMQAVAPELVLALGEAGPGAARRFVPGALREGWAWAPRKWTAVTDDTGVGNPAAATADKGRRFLDATARRIAEFLVELATIDPGAMYA